MEIYNRKKDDKNRIEAVEEKLVDVEEAVSERLLKEKMKKINYQFFF